MKINIVAVGKIKEQFFTDAIKEYEKRLSKFCELKIVEVQEASNYKNLDEKSRLEGELLLSKCKGFLIALDGKSKQLSSEEIAGVISEKMLNGISEISFIIGASNGIHNSIKAIANEKISFSPMTFPHQLMRVIFLEQLYRAFTILNNISYHK